MKDRTELLMLIDTSSSMSTCCKEAQIGIDSFIKKQAEDGTDTTLTIVDFNTNVVTKVEAMKLSKTLYPEYKLVPMGSTALYDAICQTVDSFGARLNDMQESDRPDKVVFVILTDGEENSSRFFNQEASFEKIKHQEDKYNWKFVYLGANQDAFQVGGALGFDSSRTSNYSVKKFDKALENTFESVLRYKTGLCNDVFYTDEEKRSMND